MNLQRIRRNACLYPARGACAGTISPSYIAYFVSINIHGGKILFRGQSDPYFGLHFSSTKIPAKSIRWEHSMNFLKVFCVVGLAMAVGVLMALLGSVLIVRLEHVDTAKIWEIASGAGAVVSGLGAIATALVTYFVYRIASSFQRNLIESEARFLTILVEQDFQEVFEALRDCYHQFCLLRAINSQEDEYGREARRTAAGALVANAQRLDLTFCRGSLDKMHLLKDDLKAAILDVFRVAPRLRSYLSYGANVNNPKLTALSKVDFESRIGELALLLMPVLAIKIDSLEMSMLKTAVAQTRWMKEPGRTCAEVEARGRAL